MLFRSDSKTDISVLISERIKNANSSVMTGMVAICFDEPLTAEAVQLYMKKHVQMLGLPEDVTPHTMRHCFACHALEDGVSHTFIQQLLGHRSPNSTDVYLQMTAITPKRWINCWAI